MQLIVPDPTYDHPERNLDDYKSFLASELLQFASSYELTETDIGRGASEPCFLVEILKLVKSVGFIAIPFILFFQGKRINDNLDAWVQIAKKIYRSVRKIKERFGECLISKELANFISIAEISVMDDDEIRSIKLEHEIVIPISPINVELKDELNSCPQAYYINIINTNERLYHIFAIKSSGDIVFKLRIDSSDWMAF